MVGGGVGEEKGSQLLGYFAVGTYQEDARGGHDGMWYKIEYL